jgi:hypothetical protein
VASALTHRVRVDAAQRPRGCGFYRVRGVNADAGGRLDEKNVQMVIFIQKRLL